jgi:hypothetical protein
VTCVVCGGALDKGPGVVIDWALVNQTSRVVCGVRCARLMVESMAIRGPTIDPLFSAQEAYAAAKRAGQ